MTDGARSASTSANSRLPSSGSSSACSRWCSPSTASPGPSSHPLEPEYVRSEIDPQFAGIAAPDEIVITAQFTIDFGGGAGELGICIPYAALDPVRGLIARAGQPDAAGTDALHASALARQLQLADVEVVATLAHAAITCQQLLEMRAGDVITIDRQEVITAAADGVPLFDCRYGVVNGRYALKVERLAAPHGDAHA
ncbi:MAG: FliM/FliN family flagellar motor switch protein [Burkholderiales bacterium]|nr:FliM/FliN family flagellar motor switch protein [Burkholderiales bacterium]